LLQQPRDVARADDHRRFLALGALLHLLRVARIQTTAHPRRSGWLADSAQVLRGSADASRPAVPDDSTMNDVLIVLGAA
jgi:hypothetical protein